MFLYYYYLCDGGAYLLSVAALPSQSSKEGGYSYSYTTPMLVQLAESARVRASVRRSWVRTQAYRANVHKSTKPAP